jgi:hypothetical protein
VNLLQEISYKGEGNFRITKTSSLLRVALVQLDATNIDDFPVTVIGDSNKDVALYIILEGTGLTNLDGLSKLRVQHDINVLHLKGQSKLKMDDLHVLKGRELESLNLANTELELELKDLHKYVQHCIAIGISKLVPVLGLLKINSLRSVHLQGAHLKQTQQEEFEGVMEKYLRLPRTAANMLACQDELIDAGFTEAATL